MHHQILVLLTRTEGKGLSENRWSGVDAFYWALTSTGILILRKPFIATFTQIVIVLSEWRSLQLQDRPNLHCSALSALSNQFGQYGPIDGRSVPIPM